MTKKVFNSSELLKQFNNEVVKELENSEKKKRDDLYKKLYDLGEKYYKNTKS